MILKNTGYNSYSQLIEEMNKEESKKNKRVHSEIKVLLFKDQLFEEFCKLIKNVNPKSYLYDDINERWAYFLNAYVKIQNDKLDENFIRKKFEKFKNKINIVLSRTNHYEKFKNPFLKMNEGLYLFRHYQEGLSNYFNINEKLTKFFFAQPYIQAIIKISNAKIYDEQFIKDVIEYFNETKKRIQLLINESLRPFLDSFKQWEEFINIYKIHIEGFEEYSKNMGKLLIEEPYENSEFFKQYENIEIIFKKIIEKLDTNIAFFEIFNNIGYLNKKQYLILVIEEELDDWLSTDKNKFLKKEIEYFYDASFKYVFNFKLTFKINTLDIKLWLFWFLAFILLITSFAINPIAGFVVTGAIYAGTIFFIGNAYNKYKEVEIEGNTIFADLLRLIIKTFKDKNSDRKERILHFRNVAYNNDNSKIIQSNKNFIISQIFKYVENKFNEIKKLDIIKFLLFIDNYMSEEIWIEKIKDIIIITFKNIYESNFNKRYEIFKNKVKTDNYIKHLQNYNEIFDMFLKECILEINKLSNKKDYNKKTGLNCLEHLIMNLNSHEITEDIAKNTVIYMIYFKLITQDGIINIQLFEDCFTKKENNNIIKLSQPFKINIINRIDKNIPLINISSTDEFTIKGFEIPMVDASFIDLSNFYSMNNYNVKQQLEKIMHYI